MCSNSMITKRVDTLSLNSQIANVEIAPYIVLVIVTSFLTPIYFGIVPKSWNVLYASQILRETAKFSIINIAPPNYIYLQFFLGFEYLWATKIEYKESWKNKLTYTQPKFTSLVNV